MDLRHLRYFTAVAEERHFGRAAQRLGIAQPPLSRQIQDLESELGFSLFDRSRRRVELTPAGAVFLAHVRRVFDALELGVHEARRASVGETGRLVLGYLSSLAYSGITELVRTFRGELPAVELALREMPPQEQIEALKDGRIDVGFGRIRLEDPRIRRIVLREERMIVALPLGHPLLDAGAALSLHDLLSETLIIFPKAPRPSYADQVLAAFHDRGLKPERIYETRELQIALGLVAAGEGVSVVPGSVYGLKRDDVGYKELDDPNLVSPIIMSTRLLDESADLRAMLELIYQLYDEAKMDYLPPPEERGDA